MIKDTRSVITKGLHIDVKPEKKKKKLWDPKF